MPRAAIGTLALALFLAWRGLDSGLVAVTDPVATRDADLAWRLDERGRIAHAFADLPAPRQGEASALARLGLLERHVPERALVFLLHPFRGAEATLEFSLWQRSLALLFPRVLQPLPALPVPDDARRPPYDALPVYLLDLRSAGPPLGEAWQRVAGVPGAELFRERGAPR